MGNPISRLRKEIDQSDHEKMEKEERLNILETMVKSRLENAKRLMLNGERGDQEIHTGTVVELTHQVSVVLSSSPHTDLEEAISDFFDGRISKGFEKIVKVGVDSVLGNSNMGQHEGNNMFIAWTDNALLRLDAYYYRWNFSSKSVISNVEGASGVILLTRVIDIAKTDPQVLTWAISRQAKLAGMPRQAGMLIDEALAILKKSLLIRAHAQCKGIDSNHNRGLQVTSTSETGTESHEDDLKVDTKSHEGDLKVDVINDEGLDDITFEPIKVVDDNSSTSSEYSNIKFPCGHGIALHCESLYEYCMEQVSKGNAEIKCLECDMNLELSMIESMLLTEKQMAMDETTVNRMLATKKQVSEIGLGLSRNRPLSASIRMYFRRKPSSK